MVKQTQVTLTISQWHEMNSEGSSLILYSFCLHPHNIFFYFHTTVRPWDARFLGLRPETEYDTCIKINYLIQKWFQPNYRVNRKFEGFVVDFRWFPVFSVTPSKIIKGRTSRQTSNDDSMMTYLAVPSAGCTPERRGSLEDCKSLQDHDLGDSSLFAR